MNDATPIGKLKLYSYYGDYGGGAVCLAESAEEALEKIHENTYFVYAKIQDITEEKISEVIEFRGDM